LFRKNTTNWGGIFHEDAENEQLKRAYGKVADSTVANPLPKMYQKAFGWAIIFLRLPTSFYHQS